jgi:hypothetical protein
MPGSSYSSLPCGFSAGALPIDAGSRHHRLVAFIEQQGDFLSEFHSFET